MREKFANTSLGRATLLIAITAVMAVAFAATGEGSGKVEGKKLTPEEENVIVHKGTERAFSGKYVGHKKDGTYVCKRCGEPLFKSESKFDSKSGWPSFDDAIEGAVIEVRDDDEMRTEIICANCEGHLGHVFYGEGFTQNDTRHCVNSVSLDFKPKPAPTEIAIFAGGCFWGVEYYMSKSAGVTSVKSGYIGGNVENPTYKQVCYEDTGHAEAVEVTFNPKVTTFEKLAKLFFEIHDPTQEDRQGPDIGTQYRSAIFPRSFKQKKVARSLIRELKKTGLDVVTTIEDADTFWPAEQYHQDYYDRKGGVPYCHTRVKRFE